MATYSIVNREEMTSDVNISLVAIVPLPFDVIDGSSYHDDNATVDAEEEMELLCHLYNFVMYAVIVGSICLLGTVGNTMAFVVFSKDKIKTSTSFLLQALAVIDTLFLAIVFPLYSVTAFLEFAEFSEDDVTTIKVHLIPVAYILQLATIWVVVLVGMNRYIAVCHPFKAARLCTVTQAKIQLTAVLLFSVVYTIPKFVEVPTSLIDDEVYNIIYNNAMYMIFLLVLPLICLTGLNIQLMRALKNIRQNRARIHQQSLRQQQDNNVTLVLIVVVIVLIICQTPALANHIFWTLLPEHHRDCGGFQFFFRRFSNMLVVTNSAVNFPIYVLFNNRFRQILMLVCNTSKGPLDASSPLRAAANGRSRKTNCVYYEGTAQYNIELQTAVPL